MSGGGREFGARPRDWGWHPKINQDIWNWYEEAIALAIEIESESEVRLLLASVLRSLWPYPGCREALIRAAKQFVNAQPWIEGWISCRAALRYDGESISPDAKVELEQLANLLKPEDLLNRARAVVINMMPGGGGWDFADGEDEDGDVMNPWVKANEIAKEVGRALARDPEVRTAFIAEVLIEPHAQRAFECGLGLAEGADDLDVMWYNLAAAYRSAPTTARNATVLGGFIHGAGQRDQVSAAAALDGSIEDPALLPVLPYLQARVGMDAAGISRLRVALKRGGLAAAHFRSIANGCVENSPAEDLAALLKDISSLPDGVAVALDILHMRFFSRSKNVDATCDVPLILVGRDLLMGFDFSMSCDLRDFAAGEVVRASLSGEEARWAAEKVCQRLAIAVEAYTVSMWNLSCTLEALFETHPFVALDAFLLSEAENFSYILTDVRRGKKSAVEELGGVVLQKWASLDPNKRFPLLGRCLRMFEGEAEDDGGFSPLFISMLDAAPEKRQFLGELWERVHPKGWSGSLADILARRKGKLVDLAKDADEQVREWVADAVPELEQWIEVDRKRERAREESFE